MPGRRAGLAEDASHVKALGENRAVLLYITEGENSKWELGNPGIGRKVGQVVKGPEITVPLITKPW